MRTITSSNGDDRRGIAAKVFKGVDNRMKSGYLLRDAVNKIAGIHFTSSDGLHTLDTLYESMLHETRGAACDSGVLRSLHAVQVNVAIASLICRPSYLFCSARHDADCSH